MGGWLRFVRPGDWLIVACAAVGVALALAATATRGPAEKVQIRAAGRLVAELPLTERRVVDIGGPLGTTRIEVERGRARVASDPGPRQYCVKQGWLDRPNAIAICAPNQVSLALVGRGAAYDTVHY